MLLFFAFFLSCLSSFYLLKALIPFLGLRLLDSPNERSSHSSPRPRGGGLSFVLVSSFASALSLMSRVLSSSNSSALIAAPLIALPLAFLGYLDDRHNLSVGLRFLVQLITALFAVYASNIVIFSVDYSIFIVFLVLTGTAIINFVNFMDGLDGLVAGCLSVLIIGIAIRLSAPWPIWSLVGSLIGFLFLNWSPAKVFMGDVGSTFLGAVYAVLLLQLSVWSDVIAFLLVGAPLLSDAFICVIRRFFAGQGVFHAHRLHLFQRLHQAGWSHSRVSGFYIAATTILAISFFWGGLTLLIFLVLFELLVGIYLDQRVAVPFALAS